MKFAFRVDASIDIGTGHVMRCLTLADELTRLGHTCLFLCSNLTGHLGDTIRVKGFQLYLLERETIGDKPLSWNDHSQWLGSSWQFDAKKTSEVLEGHLIQWLIVDHYALDANWEKELSSFVNNIMVIDDLADRQHHCDLLLDQNLGRKEADYENLINPECMRLIGPSYALLRSEFSCAREKCLKRREGRGNLKRILISLGGGDIDNVTFRIIESLEKLKAPETIELDIIMGTNAIHIDKVIKKADELPFKASVSTNVNDMAERMSLADLSIGAAGGTAWERACLGLPSIIIVLAQNQIQGATALNEVGAASVIFDPALIENELPSIMSMYFQSEQLSLQSEAASKLTQGDGATRVSEILVEYG